MTTLESRYAERVSELRGGQAAPTEAEVAYMLDALPYIKEYTRGGQRVANDPPVAQALGGFVQITRTDNRHEGFQQYMADVERVHEAMVALPRHRTHVGQREVDVVCPQCDVGMVLNGREAEALCMRCGMARPYMDISEHGLTFDQEIEQTSIVASFAYKRLNHFTEWLNSLQARENTEIPGEVLEAVRAEFKKEGASKRGDIKPAKVRGFLKKLKLNKWYEHTHAICNAINGVPAPKIPQHLENTLKRMFNAIQEPFEKHKPPSRKNFLSYSFTLYKFCQLLGEDEYLQYFPLLKSAEKLYAQDAIWKKICAELSWEFIPSL